MSVSSISSTTSLVASQFMPLSTKSTTDDAPATSAPGAGRFANAITNAFASIGISLDGTSTTSTATTDASTADGSDALGSFLQSLLAALHSQSAGATPSPTDASSSDQDPSQQAASASGTVASTSRGDHVAHAHHGHGGKLEANLKSLISELQSSTATTADPGTVASTSSTAPTDPALATLENKFDALLSAKGSSSTSSNDSLATFLQTLAAGLHGAPPTGNVVSTLA